MRIALCDDDEAFRAQAAQTLELLLENRGLSAEVASFPSAEALMSDGLTFDIYLLDVIMPDGMDGLSLGYWIRASQPNAVIVFLTVSREFAVEAYAVEAIGYVLKPFTSEAFGRTLDRALRQLSAVLAACLTCKVAEGFVRVPLRDVTYVEASGRYQLVHTVNGRSFVQSLSLQELWEKLADDGRFVRVGRQIIVNMAHVTGFSNAVLTLAGGQTFTVPRRSLSEVRQAFMRFYSV